MDQQGFAESSSTTSQHILPVSNFFFSKKPHKNPAGFATLTMISANVGDPRHRQQGIPNAVKPWLMRCLVEFP